MKKPAIFIDGMEGTTGLVIWERIRDRDDIEVIKIDPEKRKDAKARKECFSKADLSILCLPDVAAVEAVSLMGENCRVIDASTAHRTATDWVYGIPELNRDEIKNAKRVANPGCHATGFIMTVYPLIKSGLLRNDYPLCCQSITGYSGGGKKLIADYETMRVPGMESPRVYGLNLSHKHLPEMQTVCGLVEKPLFTPILGDFYQGMSVMVPLMTGLLGNVTAGDIAEALQIAYKDEPFVNVITEISGYLDSGCLNPMALNGTNRIEIFVVSGDNQILLLSRFDNLGKGACGAAIQNMNIMLGLEETSGLIT